MIVGALSALGLVAIGLIGGVTWALMLGIAMGLFVGAWVAVNGWD